MSDPTDLASNLGLAMFLWQAEMTDEKGEECQEYYFGLFDLNLWYQVCYSEFKKIMCD